MDMQLITDLAGLVLVAAVFGGMLFFAFVTAPVIFTSLEAPVASGLIRRMFPVYYFYMGTLSALATLLAAFSHEIAAVLMAGVCAAFWFAREILMPRINELRDNEQEGDVAAGRKFKLMHRLSVLLNLVQMAVSLVALVLLA
jgi:hypothetical protein